MPDMLISPRKLCRPFVGPKHRIPKGWHYVTEGACPCGCGQPVVYVRRGGWDDSAVHYALISAEYWLMKATERLKELQRRKAGAK